MRIKRAEATNFASYQKLAFDFTETQGLVLIQGATGSGKSTLCDLIPWILFGRTAKGGAVDEIRRWGSTEPTTGKLVLGLPDGEWEVTRHRGKTNDLAFRRVGAEDLSRGKDLTDTQRLLNEKLGLDYDLYSAGSYYHEFSQTAAFFTTTAKNRRTICENLVDLSLATTLQERLKDERRVLDQTIQQLTSDHRVESAKLQLLLTKERQEHTKSNDWEREKKHRLHRCAKQYDDFENNRRRVVSNSCPTCGTVLRAAKEVVDTSPNPHSDRLLEIEEEKNPYSGELRSYDTEISGVKDRIRAIDVRHEVLSTQLADYELLRLAADNYRRQSIENTIRYVESRTNDLLAAFFDAEIRVLFSAQSSDKLDVSILKDGHDAVFTQLSKGQRQLLKLCFGLAVMEAIQNHHGISLNQLWIDEATDGLDENRKLQALRMLETVAQQYGTIFLVEHSEALKSMVTTKYQVTLVNGESQIAQA